MTVFLIGVLSGFVLGVILIGCLTASNEADIGAIYYHEGFRHGVESMKDEDNNKL